jgi:hypothetical protein
LFFSLADEVQDDGVVAVVLLRCKPSPHWRGDLEEIVAAGAR